MVRVSNLLCYICYYWPTYT